MLTLSYSVFVHPTTIHCLDGFCVSVPPQYVLQTLQHSSCQKSISVDLENHCETELQLKMWCVVVVMKEVKILASLVYWDGDRLCLPIAYLNELWMVCVPEIAIGATAAGLTSHLCWTSRILLELCVQSLE